MWGSNGMIEDRDAFNALNASRKADRETIAKMLIFIGEKHGAKIERRESPANPGYCGQGIDLFFTLNGVGASVDIDNLFGGGHSLISWYNEWPIDYRPAPGRYCLDFSGAFNSAVGENGYWSRPHHKATSCPADWYSLAMFLDAGLSTAADHKAFLPIDALAAT